MPNYIKAYFETSLRSNDNQIVFYYDFDMQS